ncbi:MAG: hypothetical protein Q4E59_00895 [Bacteroidales bacterium]|nr:hypothetical protein [Bacteroidales bacterium]
MEISKENYPRLLIVGTVPYNPQSTSRAFDAYFRSWQRDNLAQVFSDPNEPVKGHCGHLFQITDRRIVSRWMGRNIPTGKAYRYEDLGDDVSTFTPGGIAAKENKVTALMYKIGRGHSPFTHLLRKLLWRKAFWNTSEFNHWLEAFNPECVFLSFSNDFFILEIALYVAEKFDIPICSSTGDDYYFNTKFSLNPLWYLYHGMYRRLNRRVFAHKGSAIYISDKIRDKYNEAFGLNGQTVYLVSDIKRRPFRPINPENIKIRYFGNIRMGRNKSLCDIADALGRINPHLMLEVYSGEPDAKITGIFKAHPNLAFKGRIPYSEVMLLSVDSDILVVVEGFSKRDVQTVRYSLSTKVADSLASGCNVLAYGAPETGAMEYIKSTHCATVCHSIDQLVTSLSQLFNDVNLQKQNYQQAEIISKKNHVVEQSNARVENIIRHLVDENKESHA